MNHQMDPYTVEKWEDKLKQLVENNHIAEARQVLSEIHKMGLLSTVLTDWQIALEEPKISVKKKASGVYLNKNFKWLQRNAHQFKGKWVALKEGILIDSHESLIVLRQSLENFDQLIETVFMKIED